MDKKNTKRKRHDLSGGILFTAGLVLIVAALVMLIPNLLDHRRSNETYENLKTEYVTEEGQAEKTEEMEEETETPEDDWWYQDIRIHVGAMKEENPDIIGWIRFDHIEQLSYPVLYSGDDETYLRTDIYGNSTIAGCIFMEGMNHPDFEDSHTILYGHNMKNLSMFGSLKKYKTEDFYKQNPFFTIYTTDMAYRYQIFSYRDVPETDSVYSVGFEADDAFKAFVHTMIQKSYYDTGIEVTKDDKVMTLSTCSSTGNRFVVHAVRVGEHDYDGH